jgi:hypothetical protein
MSRWLTNDDVFRLTGKRRYTAQCKELTARGIRWTPGKGGEPLVEADALDAKQPKARNSGPRWNLINA